MGTKVIHAEWIGKHAKVVSSTNKSLNGFEGRIVNETRNTIVIETQKGLKKVQKHGTVFEIDGQEVTGDDVLAAPEERIKLKVE